MKIIINESQLRMIVENEGEDSLIDFTHVYRTGFPPEDWDDMYEHLNKKKGGIYDGYYIDSYVNLSYSDVTELKYLVKVGGSLNLNGSKIKSLGNLKSVGGFLDLYNTLIETLGNLESVGGHLDLEDSLIKSLGNLKSVGGFLDLKNTPLFKKTTEEELRSKINVGGEIYL